MLRYNSVWPNFHNLFLLPGKPIDKRQIFIFRMRTAILRMFQRIVILTALWISFAPLLHASEPAFVRESLRARGMGNAFTAAANDEMLFFYNPAGLSDVKKGDLSLFTQFRQHFLNFFPLPQGQGSLRPIIGSEPCTGEARSNSVRRLSQCL